jgi:hypothetical protein
MSKGNIFVKFSPTRGVYLYTQRQGAVTPAILKRALTRGRNRWGDTTSLSHVIYGEMAQAHILETEGYGITPVIVDNDEPILVVDDANERVGIFFEGGRLYRAWKYTEFIAIPDRELTFEVLAGGYGPEEYEGTAPEGSPEVYRFSSPVVPNP